MKRKEIIQLAVAAVILTVAGIVIYHVLVPNKDKSRLTYEKITPIQSDFNQDALKNIADQSKSKDFYSPPDLKNGVGNPQPFSPLP